MENLFALFGLLMIVVVVVGSDANGKKVREQGGSYLIGFLIPFFIFPYAIICFLNRKK